MDVSAPIEKLVREQPDCECITNQCLKAQSFKGKFILDKGTQLIKISLSTCEECCKKIYPAAKAIALLTTLGMISWAAYNIVEAVPQVVALVQEASDSVAFLKNTFDQVK